MDLTRRFLFHADACAYGGRIVRPRHVVILSEASSSIGVSGGRAETRVKGRHFKPFLKTGPAATIVETGFDDTRATRALTLGEGREEDLTSTSSAKAVVEGVDVGGRLSVRQLSALLQARSTPGQDEPSIVVGSATIARGVVIDGAQLTVEFDVAAFGRVPTYSKFMEAGLPGCLHDKPASSSARKPVLTTIVKSLRWTKKPPPTARIEGHTVKVADFGRIFFGEMLVDVASRRLTVMRLRLGSPEGGMVDFADVQTNGSWYPPIL